MISAGTYAYRPDSARIHCAFAKSSKLLATG